MLDASSQITPENQLADSELEKTLLSAILYDAKIIDRVGDLVAEDFADPIHGELFAAMQNLRAERLPINTLNLRGKAGLSQMGREAIMAQLKKLSFAGELPNVSDLSRQLIDFSLRRQLLDIHRRYQHAATDASQSVLAQLAALRLDTDTLVSRLSAQGKTRLTHKEATEMMMQELKRDLRDVLVPCGISSIDRALAGGFRRGDYTILAGRPGAGKSTLGLSVALGAAKLGHGVLYFTPEMTTEQLALRAASAMASTRHNPIPYERVMSKQVTEKEDEEFYRVAINMPELPIFYDGSASLLASELQARVKQARLDFQEKGLKLDLVVVDHLGKIRPTNRYKGNRVQEVGELSEAMVVTGKEENVAMLVLHQLNRSVESRENKRPSLSDLRDCLPGDAKVLNADTGMDVPVRDIVDQKLRFNVWGLDDASMRLVKKPITDAWMVGPKALLMVKTRTGRILRCSGGHRVLSENGWAAAETLSVGKCIAVPRVIPAEPTWRCPVGYITPGRALLLGSLLGDGHLHGSAALSIAPNDDPQFYIRLAKKEFGIDASVKKPYPGRNNRSRTVIFSTGRGMSGGQKNPMTRWLRARGVWGVIGANKRVPKEIFGCAHDILAAVLRGLFQSDGSFSGGSGKPKQRRKSGHQVRFCSISEGLAHDVYRGLMRLGIVARIRPQKHQGFPGYGSQPPSPKRQDHIWLVSISGHEDITKFLDVVGFVGRKQQSARARMRRRENRDHQQIDRLPHSVNSYIDHRRAVDGFSHSDLGWRQQNKRMSRATGVAVAEKIADPQLLALATSDVLWDEVESIVPIGDSVVYDLTVADVHNFVVDDVITHNSGHLEQDADIVAFAYREAYYLEQKPENEGSMEEAARIANLEKVRNDLELLVAKNRRGRTGVIKLYCDVSCNLVEAA